MKYLKLFWMIVFIFSPLLQLNIKAEVLSSNDEVTLTVSSDGVSKDEATKLALRSAIEQAYGAFISSNTTFINDEIIKDEIVTISSGNVKSYKEISYEKMPNGKIFVVLKATVSLSKLANYAISKGERVEFNGASFAMNMKLRETNKINELKVLENLLPQLKDLFMNAFDYQLTTKDPFEDGSSYRIPIIINIKYNENLPKAINLIKNTISSLYISKEELKNYESSRTPYYQFSLGFNKEGTGKVLNPKCIRNDISSWCKQVISLFWEGVKNFKCNSNIGVLSLVESDKGDFEIAYINNSPEFIESLQNSIFTKRLDLRVREGILGGYQGERLLGFEFWIKKNNIIEYDIVLSPSRMEMLKELEIVKIE